MDIHTQLRAELDRRRTRNPRYSLRAFAQHLGVHHSTLSRLLRKRSRLTAPQLDKLGRRLGLDAAGLAAARLDEAVARLVALRRHPSFRPSSRWIATRTGLPLDDVNVALQHLVRTRALALTSVSSWSWRLE